jgi:hypothetical protein
MNQSLFPLSFALELYLLFVRMGYVWLVRRMRLSVSDCGETIRPLISKKFVDSCVVRNDNISWTWVIHTSIPLLSGFSPGHDRLVNSVEPRRFDNPIEWEPLSYSLNCNASDHCELVMGSQAWLPECKEQREGLQPFYQYICRGNMFGTLLQAYAGRMTGGRWIGLRLLLWVPTKINYPRSLSPCILSIMYMYVECNHYTW